MHIPSSKMHQFALGSINYSSFLLPTELLNIWSRNYPSKLKKRKTWGKALSSLKACWLHATSVPVSRSQRLTVPCHTALQRYYQEAEGKWQWKKHDSKGQLQLKARASHPWQAVITLLECLNTPTGKMELLEMYDRDPSSEEYKKTADC